MFRCVTKLTTASALANLDPTIGMEPRIISRTFTTHNRREIHEFASEMTLTTLVRDFQQKPFVVWWSFELILATATGVSSIERRTAWSTSVTQRSSWEIRVPTDTSQTRNLGELYERGCLFAIQQRPNSDQVVDREQQE